MKMTKSNMQFSALALTAAVALSACGGGGGSPGGNTTVATTTTTTIAVSSIITSGVPAPTYGAATPKDAAFQYLNTLRNTCGFGLLQQDARIDIAAQGHADYLIANNLMGHFENQGTHPAGFIGTTLQDRYAYASYPFLNQYGLGYGEVIAQEPARFGTDAGTANVMNLMAAPYHGVAMLLGMRDVGIGLATGGGRTVFVLDFGSTASRTPQQLAGNAVVTYPCQGVTGVLSQIYGDEDPRPIAGRDLGAQPIGHPIYIKVRDGQTLTMTAADLRVDGGATPLTLRKLDKASDANARIIDDSAVMYMPDAPLAINTTYRFTGTGTNNGQAVNINFTFTTGAF